MGGYVLHRRERRRFAAQIGAALRQARLRVGGRDRGARGPRRSIAIRSARRRRARHQAGGRRTASDWPTSCATTPRRATTPILFVATTPPRRQPPRGGAAPVRARRLPDRRRSIWPRSPGSPIGREQPSADAPSRATGTRRRSDDDASVDRDAAPLRRASPKSTLAIRSSSASGATSSAARNTWSRPGRRRAARDARSGRRSRACLQRLYARRAQRARCCCCATRPRRSSSSSTAIRCRCAPTCSARRLGQILLEKRLITSEALDESVRPHAEGEAPSGRDPGRDGRAVAATTWNARWSNRWKRSCSRSSRGPTASSCSRPASTRIGRAPRSSNARRRG